MIKLKNINITEDGCELFKEFSLSLFTIMATTYLGDDITNKEERLNHFNWCWVKNIDNYKNKGVVIGDSISCYDFYLNFMFNFFYSAEVKDSSLNLTIDGLLVLLFSYDNLEVPKNLNRLIPIYKKLADSLEIKKDS